MTRHQELLANQRLTAAQHHDVDRIEWHEANAPDAPTKH